MKGKFLSLCFFIFMKKELFMYCSGDFRSPDFYFTVMYIFLFHTTESAGGRGITACCKLPTDSKR